MRQHQQQRKRSNGHNRSGFCGAYGYNGFRKDGVKSVLNVASQLHQSVQDE
ncbi:hypothetical protein SOV92_19245 [Pectobacterium brasiliense]|uniref:Uncharacterized protein n=1 Tax=Pectobacterium brasiliense TaxID=180957 RepID=A0AAW9H6Z2_9GAMM|nr:MULTISPECIES: hypothetical protein [Pectobacterium]MDY4379927.1 hypothetical protein [Pectobacterium brasiliense]